MSPFTFHSVPTIVFGSGKIAELGELARPLGRRALIIHNGSDVGGGGAVDKATEALRKANLDVTFYRQRGEPTVANVDEALATARGCDLFIGLGGGSAIDCAKATAAIFTNGGSALDYMEVIGAGKKITRAAAPWIGVPTTAGTGAEVTRNAVIGSPRHKYKASIRSELLMARVALIDPELAVGSPREVTAASGMDAIVQLLEAATSVGSNELTRPLAHHGLLSGIAAFYKVLEEPHELMWREAMAMAALRSGIALTNAGLGAVHGLAAPLGAKFPAPHGAVCGVLLPHVVEANIRSFTRGDPGIQRYSDVGVALAYQPTMDDEPAAQYVLDACRELAEEAALPPLRTYGVTESAIPEIVAMAKKSSSMRYNPVALPDEALARILRAAL